MGAAVALLLGAGRGERLDGGRPKAFVEIGGRPLLAHAADNVEGCPDIEGMVVAVPGGHESEARRLVGGSGKLLGIVAGGDTRRASVREALAAAPRTFDVVVCHDVARPFAEPALFSSVLAGLEEADGVVPALRIADTVKRVRGDVVDSTIDRRDLVAVQTPQAFRRSSLEAAHRAEAGVDATDDAALLEVAGFRVVTVPGDPRNMKVTTRGDLDLARRLAEMGEEPARG